MFDLREYYRSASDREVEEFIRNEKLKFENAEAFCRNANTYVRRKIAMINDNSILNKVAAEEIKKTAKTIGIEIAVDDNKIVIPEEKTTALEVSAFLDEEAYRGSFSNDLLLADSKRVLKKGKADR